MASGSTTVQPPIDYSDVMMLQSNNNLTAMRTQIGANMINQQQINATQQLGIMTNAVVQLEGLDTKRQIALMNFYERMDKHYLDFEKAKMDNEVDVMEFELRAQIDRADAGLDPEGPADPGPAQSSTLGSQWQSQYQEVAGDDEGSYNPTLPDAGAA